MSAVKLPGELKQNYLPNVDNQFTWVQRIIFRLSVHGWDVLPGFQPEKEIRVKHWLFTFFFEIEHLPISELLLPSGTYVQSFRSIAPAVTKCALLTDDDDGHCVSHRLPAGEPKMMKILDAIETLGSCWKGLQISFHVVPLFSKSFHFWVSFITFCNFLKIPKYQNTESMLDGLKFHLNQCSACFPVEGGL
jgi:hypothetical protein